MNNRLSLSPVEEYDQPSVDEITVLVVDDHQLLVDALSQRLSKEPDFKVSVAHDFASATDMITAHGSFDVILLDVRMPGMNGIASVIDIVKDNAPGATAIFSGEVVPAVVKKCINHGARGFIPKSIALKSLPTAIRLIATGQIFVPLDMTLDLGEEGVTRTWNITDREIFTLRMAADGRTNKEIAWELDVTEMTIKMVMRQICSKLDAKNRAHAVIIARGRGII